MSVTSAAGFVAAGTACGLKPSGDPDLALVATADHVPVAAAGVFTSNKLCAAPVQLCRASLSATGGSAAAVVLNSGNANAATGARGLDDARAMAAATAHALGVRRTEVLVCSTGLIGRPLAVDRIVGAVPGLVAGLAPTGAPDAAEAIRTTDTHRKEHAVTVGGFTVGGMAKGAAMLAPNMGTMLAVLTTDAALEPSQLHAALVSAVDDSFNRLTTDGSTSTNDTVLLFSSGLAGPGDEAAVTAAVGEVCRNLAEQMAHDAEGHTKVVRIVVTGAASDADADRAARRVAESQLVKCSWYGSDPYWGRVASEMGSAGVAFDPATLRISYGGVLVSVGAVDVDHDAGAVATHVQGPEILIEADLGLGAGAGWILTNDLTHAYVDENMGTS